MEKIAENVIYENVPYFKGFYRRQVTDMTVEPE